MALALSFRVACAACTPGPDVFFCRSPSLASAVVGTFVLCKSAGGEDCGESAVLVLIYVRKSDWDQPQALISRRACHSLRKITRCTDQLRVGYTMKRF